MFLLNSPLLRDSLSILRKHRFHDVAEPNRRPKWVFLVPVKAEVAPVLTTGSAMAWILCCRAFPPLHRGADP